MNINEIKNSNFSQAQLNELQALFNQKAYQDSSTAAGNIIVDYDAELQRLTWRTSPSYAYLKTKIESSTNSIEVGYRMKKQMTDASFIAEGAEIPPHDPSIYTKTSQMMSTLVYPIEITDIAEEGASGYVDLWQDEINDGYIDIDQRIDRCVLQGKKSDDANAFDGFTTLFKTNTFDLKAEQITLEDVDALAQAMIDVGGTPTAIFTTSAVARRLKDLILAKTVYQYNVTQILGFNVLTYVTPSGSQIPIIIDSNLEPSAKGDYLIMIDESSLRMKTLRDTYLVDLAKTKLTTSRVLVKEFTMYCRAEYQNGYLYNVNPKME